MHGCCRPFLVLFTLFVPSVNALYAQVNFDDQPLPYPSRTPPSKLENDRRESLKEYALGLLCEREDRLIEALKAYEHSAVLNPQAVGPRKAQLPLLLSLDRLDDAIAVAVNVVELEPDDFLTWHLLARMRRNQGKIADAIAALKRASECAGISDQPEIVQQVFSDLGNLLEVSGDFLGAAAALSKSVTLLAPPPPPAESGQPNREVVGIPAWQTYERIGQLYVKAKAFDRAEESYIKAGELNPEAGNRLKLYRAKIAQQQGDLKRALVFLDDYLRMQPSTAEPYELKAELLTKLNRSADIIPWLQKAAALDAGNSSINLLLADQYAKNRKFKEAAEILQTAAGSMPSSDLYRRLFHVYQDDPKTGLRQALATLNAGLQESSRVPAPPPATERAKAMVLALREDGDLAKSLVAEGLKVLGQDDSLKVETLHLLAVLAERHTQPVAAVAFYKKALGQMTPPTEAIIYSGLIRELWKTKDYSGVVATCLDGLSRSKSVKPLLFHANLARAYVVLGKADQAVLEAEAAVRIANDLDRFEIRLLQVRVLLQAKQYEAAEKLCLDMLKEHTQKADLIDIHSQLSTVYSVMKDSERSEKHLALILDLDPNNAGANNDLGYLWADQGKNLEQAEIMIRKALERDRLERRLSRLEAAEDVDKAAYVDSLAWVLFRRGQLAEARQEMERAVKLPGGEDPNLWEHLGDICHSQGERARAAQAWQHALELFQSPAVRSDAERYNDVQRKLQTISVTRQIP